MELFNDMAHSAMAPSPVFGNPKRRATNAAAPQPASEMQIAVTGSSACSRASGTPASAPKIRMGRPTLNTKPSSARPCRSPAQPVRRKTTPEEEQRGDRRESPVWLR